jgi:hypothetical protein
MKIMKIIEILKLVFVLIAVISASRMSSVVRAEKEKNKWFYSVFEVLDYIEITRQQNGKIGGLFWIFMTSFAAFIALLILPTL